MQRDTTLVSTSRLAGATWLLYFLAALPLALRTALIVPGNAAATAERILANERLYRATLVSDLASYALYALFACLLYFLLRDVSRLWAAAAAVFTLAGCLVLAVATAALTLPLFLLDGQAGHALSLAGRQELALLALQGFGQSYLVALFFFGAQWAAMGPLFAASRIVPRPIAWLLTVAGAAWIALSAAMLVAPTLAASMRGLVMPLGGIAELALALWLLIKAPGKLSADRGVLRA
jgi:hypothetical protein